MKVYFVELFDKPVEDYTCIASTKGQAKKLYPKECIKPIPKDAVVTLIANKCTNKHTKAKLLSVT